MKDESKQSQRAALIGYSAGKEKFISFDDRHDAKEYSKADLNMDSIEATNNLTSFERQAASSTRNLKSNFDKVKTMARGKS